MQEIKIYDFDFNLLASEFKCVSFDWDIRYNSVGNFEGVFTLESKIYDCCADKDFLVCVQGENQGIITSVRIEKDRIILSGKGMNYILEKRVCLPFSTKDEGTEKTAAEMVCEIVKKHCGDFMEIKTPPVLTEVNHYTRVEAKSVEEIISDILSGANAGHFVNFDTENKKWVFGIRLPNETNFVLSQPDKTLSECDYVRYLSDYATSGIYAQKPYYMGLWYANTNTPCLSDGDTSNFAKVYKVAAEGVAFSDRYYEGNYIVCKRDDGVWEQAESYGYFWHSVCPKSAEGAKKWESVLACDDISEATEMTLLNDINENVVAIVQGVNQTDLKIGDVVKIQLGSGDNLRVFSKQIKRIAYHYEWGNCFVRPTFYKMKEREDE